MQTRSGFTLIELLIVIFIMGLFTTTLVFRYSHHRYFLAMNSFSHLLKSEMELARQQAILQVNVLGLFITPTYYQFYKLKTNKTLQWVPLNEKDTFWNKTAIPADIYFNLRVNNNGILLAQNNQQPMTSPQIIFLPNGEITPFVLTIRNQYTPQQLQIIAHAGGDISLEEFS